MILQSHRKFAVALCKLRLWMPFTHMRVTWFRPRWGTNWILETMMRRQVIDRLHHAPCCPGNSWHKRRLVFQRCNCGAWEVRYDEEGHTCQRSMK